MIPLGLWDGSTENATVATALLADQLARGIDPEQGILFMIDGAKALRKAPSSARRRSTDASGTRNEMCWSTRRSATGRW